MFTSQWIFLFHDIESKCPKNSEKEQTECVVVKFDYVCDDTEFKIESTDNFPLTLTNFMRFHKIILNIWLTNMLSIFH